MTGTIKIIDLLNKIANGEEVPKKIRYINLIWEYDDEVKDYIHDDLYLFYKINAMGLIKNYVEILEEEKQEIKPITKKDFETLGYACGEIQKAFTNGWTKSLENKPLKKEKKIPEKLNIEQNSIGNHYIKNEFGTQCFLTKHSKIIADKINEILDYLESKGE